MNVPSSIRIQEQHEKIQWLPCNGYTKKLSDKKFFFLVRGDIEVTSYERKPKS